MSPNDLRHANAGTLDGWFFYGVAPAPGELHGFYRGEFLAWHPGVRGPRYVLLRLVRWWLFEGPSQRWVGKWFGSHENLNHFATLQGLRERYYFAVSHAEAYADGQPCLRLDYRIDRSLMRWVRDDVRRVGEGLYLGRMYLVRPWGKPFEVGFFSLQKGRDPC